MDRASDIKVRTVIERLNKAGHRTGTVLSKEYLYGVFGERATARWEPQPIVPVSGSRARPVHDAGRAGDARRGRPAPDVRQPRRHRPGSAHTDPTGPLGIKAARRAALCVDRPPGRPLRRRAEVVGPLGAVDRDRAGRPLDGLVGRPRTSSRCRVCWRPTRCWPGKVQIADNGGADLLYWTGPRVRAATQPWRGCARVAAAVPGVLATHDRRNPWLRLGPEAGDVVVVLPGRVAVQRPGPGDLQPDPGQPRAPGDAQHPVLHRRRLAARPARARPRPGTPAPSTSRPPWRRTSARGKPKGGYDGVNRLVIGGSSACAVSRNSTTRESVVQPGGAIAPTVSKPPQRGLGLSHRGSRPISPAPRGRRPGRSSSTSAAGWR